MPPKVRKARENRQLQDLSCSINSPRCRNYDTASHIIQDSENSIGYDADSKEPTNPVISRLKGTKCSRKSIFEPDPIALLDTFTGILPRKRNNLKSTSCIATTGDCIVTKSVVSNNSSAKLEKSHDKPSRSKQKISGCNQGPSAAEVVALPHRQNQRTNRKKKFECLNFDLDDEPDDIRHDKKPKKRSKHGEADDLLFTKQNSPSIKKSILQVHEKKSSRNCVPSPEIEDNNIQYAHNAKPSIDHNLHQTATLRNYALSVREFIKNQRTKSRRKSLDPPDILQYLESFHSLSFACAHSLRPLLAIDLNNLNHIVAEKQSKTSTAGQFVFQQTIRLSSRESLFKAVIQLEIIHLDSWKFVSSLNDDLASSITSERSQTKSLADTAILGINVVDISPWAGNELKSWISQTANQKSLTYLLASLNSYSNHAIKRAKCWAVCNSYITGLTSSSSKSTNLQSYEDPRDVHRFLGHNTFTIISSEVKLIVKWIINLDNTSGTAESRVKAFTKSLCATDLKKSSSSLGSSPNLRADEDVDTEVVNFDQLPWIFEKLSSKLGVGIAIMELGNLLLT